MMDGVSVASAPRGRPIADYSADFEVEDIKRGRSGKDRDLGRGTSPSAPRVHKQPKSISSQSSGSLAAKQPIADLDTHRLGQRQKQIDYGKNTIGYQRYLQQVPKHKRRRKGDQWLDPITPDINQNISKRCFDGQVKVWRRALHKYDIGPETDEQVRPIPYSERSRHSAQVAEEAANLSVAPSSPTNSSKSRGSLDGYMEPQVLDAGRKRCFERAFDHPAGGNPHPSKLLTSPAGPKPVAPQSAPPATAADAEPAPTPAGRCVDPPNAPGRAGGPPASLPKAPQTAPPAAAARISAGSTAESRGARRAAAGRDLPRGEDLFREWDDEDYAGLQPLDDDELERVGL